MKVVAVSLPRPVSPSWAPTTLSRSQGIAPGTTKVWVGGRVDHLAPDGARVAGVLPRGANRATDLRRDRAEIGAEEVGRDLLIIVFEQGGLGGEEYKLEASASGQADVVLCADAVTLEERLVTRFHLNVGGHGWRCDVVGVSRLRQSDCESHGESSGGRHEQNAMRGQIL